MPAAPLAVLLLASTVDPRLAEPLRLLAAVGTMDGHQAQFYADLPESLAVTELPRGVAWRHAPGAVRRAGGP